MKKKIVTREDKTQARRTDILNAALKEFSAHGFAMTKMDNIAKKAGVAKGTLYIHFPNKSALFEQMIRHALSPLFEHLKASIANKEANSVTKLQMFYNMMQTVTQTPRYGNTIRMVISEGLRNPKLIEFYHRDLITPILLAMRKFLKTAAKHHELNNNNVVQTPQIIASPLLFSIIWNGLFGNLEPIDSVKLFQIHLELLFKNPHQSSPA